jgi:hypothetical protein
MTAAQVGNKVADSNAYRQRLRNLVGGQDPIQVLSQTASILADVVARYPAELLQTRPFEGKWTPNEIIGHLGDSEWVYGYRLRLILCENEPSILGTEQEAWVAGLRYNERAPSELVEMFRTLRAWNVAEWRRMSAEDLQRKGQHNERGLESLGAMLEMLAGHDLSHLDQIRRYIQAVEERR